MSSSTHYETLVRDDPDHAALIFRTVNDNRRHRVSESLQARPMWVYWNGNIERDVFCVQILTSQLYATPWGLALQGKYLPILFVVGNNIRSYQRYQRYVDELISSTQVCDALEQVDKI